MVVIVDYNIGNSGAIYNMVKRFTGNVCVTSDYEIISAAKALILPGIGAFNTVIENITKLGLSPILILKKKVKYFPVLQTLAFILPTPIIL